MRSARAIAIRWRWPPDSERPKGGTTVSYPSGRSQMNSWACAWRAAVTISAGVASGDPNAMLSATVVEKRKVSWLTIPTAAPQRSQGDVAHILPVNSIDPAWMS